MAHQQSRRQYDKQLKIDAVEFTLKGDKTAKEIADALGINPHVLYRWRLKYMASKEKAFPGTGNPKDAEAERIRQLERELRLVTEEREIKHPRSKLRGIWKPILIFLEASFGEFTLRD